MTLLEKDGYRLHTIGKFVMPDKRDDNGRLIFDDDCIIEQPIQYGLGLESICGHKEDGSPYYYVLTFVHWDDAKKEITYDALPDRIIEEWAEHPDKGPIVKELLEIAEKVVKAANADTDLPGVSFEDFIAEQCKDPEFKAEWDKLHKKGE